MPSAPAISKRSGSARKRLSRSGCCDRPSGELQRALGPGYVPVAAELAADLGVNSDGPESAASVQRGARIVRQCVAGDQAVHVFVFQRIKQRFVKPRTDSLADGFLVAVNRGLDSGIVGSLHAKKRGTAVP